jgi:SAM-dependent methyltransferase
LSSEFPISKEKIGMSEIEMQVKSFASQLAVDINVLDVGSGKQPYKKYFSNQRYLGIDVEESGRSDSEKQPDLYFNGTNIPLGDGTVDAIICTEVLEHALDHEALIAEMYRVLKPGGKICITVPFIWGLHELPYDFRRFTYLGLAAVSTKCGFEIYEQRRLVQGVHAIVMLVESELNNYLSTQPSLNITTRVAVYMHRKIFSILKRIWGKYFSFDRIYIDNLLLARKPTVPDGIFDE